MESVELEVFGGISSIGSASSIKIKTRLIMCHILFQLRIMDLSYLLVLAMPRLFS